ncbi:hypothetical protein H9P43_006909 [Blastocladiella emersonii ATCC 22665]|nr:hypothetical protein H9P43_006909 [Blastocladiella emersonii ATCC 22665]
MPNNRNPTRRTRATSLNLLQVLAGIAVSHFDDRVLPVLSDPRFGFDGNLFVRKYLNVYQDSLFCITMDAPPHLSARRVRAVYRWLCNRGWDPSDPRTHGDGMACVLAGTEYDPERILAVYQCFDKRFHQATHFEEIEGVVEMISDHFRFYGLPKPCLLAEFDRLGLYDESLASRFADLDIHVSDDSGCSDIDDIDEAWTDDEADDDSRW